VETLLDLSALLGYGVIFSRRCQRCSEFQLTGRLDFDDPVWKFVTLERTRWKMCCEHAATLLDGG
jgi:hypothetical protein